jgi:glycosyltransferase involved in cell wall biosynthesis
LVNYLRRTAGLLTEFKPDVIIGASDSLHIVLGEYLSRRLKVPYAVDLYDNFESFGLTQFPFLKSRYRQGVRRANAVFCVSDLLAERVRSLYRATGRITTIESTIHRDQFKPRNRCEARLRLGLPCDVHLVGTAGALDPSRGIEQLYQAFEIISRRRPNLHLVLAGAAGRKLRMATLPRVHYLGQIKHDQVPDFFAALDVGIICLRDTSFGRYSFPQKAYEMAAMRIPLVAAAVGAMGQLFLEYPECLYPPGDSHQLAERICRQIDKPVIPDIPIPTWMEQAKRMEVVLKEMR